MKNWGVGVHVLTDEQILQANSLGLSKATVKGRIYRGWTPEDAVSTPLNAKRRTKGTYTFDFITLTKEQVKKAKELELTRETLKRRIHEPPFWDPDKAVTTPKRSYKKGRSS